MTLTSGEKALLGSGVDPGLLAGRLWAMSWKLEVWNPDYALPERFAGEAEATGLEGIKTDREGDWRAIRPGGMSLADWPVVYFVDGRQRIDAQISHNSGAGAMLATVIAGAVLRDGAGIRPAGEPRKLHVMLHGGQTNEPLPPELSHYQPVRVKKTDVGSLRAKVTEVMRRLEASLVNELEGGLVIVDGQIFPGEEPFKRPEQLLGYTKTQAAVYLPPEEHALLYQLQPFERTPIFTLPGTPLRRPLDVFSWYVRLPLNPSLPFFGGAGLLRVETASLEPAEAKHLADLSVSLFGQMASSPARDPRAPQNLIPIGGLELWLGRHLGSSEVVRRRIIQALFA